MRPPKVSILTSGIGLGVYMPSLLIRRVLEAEGFVAEIEILEELYTPEARERHLAHKAAYHKSFDLALMAHRMTRSVETSLAPEQVDALLARWAAEDHRHFIVWSGFWLPLLQRYRGMVNAPLQVDVCRIDAEVSASFRVHRELEAGAREIWLWRWADKRTVFEIPVNDESPLPFSQRRHRLVVHGGGWGIGTYQEALANLARQDWACDVVVHAEEEARAHRPGDRAFMVEPGWRTWQRGPEGPVFPPFAQIAGPTLREEDGALPDDHRLYEVIRRGKAIVSKPGGGTLIDSLSSATPVLLLEPMGYAEASNGALWEHLGFGVPFAAWCAAGCPAALLEKLQQNLAQRTSRGPHYARRYAAELRAELRGELRGEDVR